MILNNHKKTFELSIRLIATRQLVLLSFLFGINVASANVTNPDDWVSVDTRPDPLISEVSDIPADAHIKGMWSEEGAWPTVSVHALLMPNGKVLSYGTDEQGLFEAHHFDEWDPSLGLDAASHLTRFDEAYQDSFCSAAAYLPGGQLIIAGGNTHKTNTFYSTEAAANEEALAFAGDGANMSFSRWYASMLTLPDGSPIILGGMVPFKEEMADKVDEAIAAGWASMTPEVYDVGTNTWRSLFGATSRIAFGPDYNRTSYPRAWVAPNGLVFGVSAEQMWYLDPENDGEVISAGEFKGPYSNENPINVGSTNTAAMYDVGKVLIIGGNGRSWFDELDGSGNEVPFDASNMVTEIDINNVTPVLTELETMTFPRRMANATVLATGDVVVTGGTIQGHQTDKGVYEAEIWDAQTRTWTVGSPMTAFRGYHGNATLLTNGTILSHGSGFPIFGETLIDGLMGQVYYPPYLFESNGDTTTFADRPIIKAISGLSYLANDAMQMDMETDATVATVSLVGLSNATHAFNAGQRRIPVSFTQEGERITTAIPSYNLTPPGYYQVVAINQDGVPSLGTIIGIGENIATPTIPTTPYVPSNITVADSPAITLGNVASFSANAVDGATYSWNFGDGTTPTSFSANPNTTHTYQAAGAYPVTLTVNDNGNTIIRNYIQAVKPNTTATNNSPNASTPIAYESRSGLSDRIWVVNPDNDSVTVIDADAQSTISTIVVGDMPSSVAVSSDGNVWVSNKKSASISIISADTLAVTNTIALDHGSQPHGLVFSPDQDAAFVVLEASGYLIRLNTITNSITGRVDIGQHARHLSVNHDTSTILVSRFITPPITGESTAVVDTSNAGGELLVVNPQTMSVINTVLLQHSNKPDTQIQGSGIPNYLGAAVISPDNTYAWLPSKQDNIKRGALRNQNALNFQNTVRAISSRVDLTQMEEQFGKRIDHDNASLASATLIHPNGVYAFSTLETSREVAVFDAIQGSELFRFDVGRAPQGLIISADGKTLFIKNFMDRNVSVIDLSALIDVGSPTVSTVDVVYTVGLNDEDLSANVFLGKQLFYDAKDTRLAKDSYMSCATCHSDGGHDGRVWDMTDVGEGLRNTIGLKGKAGLGHGFLHWSANFDEVQDFEGQIRTLAGGTGLMSNAEFNTGTRSSPLGDPKAGVSADLDALADYVSSLDTFDATPYATSAASMSASAIAGKAIFQANNCMSCHADVAKRTISADAGAMRNIGTIAEASGKRLGETLTAIDVPTLRNAWRTGPFLHDGSATTIDEAISAHADTNLSGDDLVNLAQYIREIDVDLEEDDTNLAQNNPPTIASFRTASGNTTYQEGETLILNATATDSDGSISSVSFYNGSELAQTLNSAPYSLSLNALAVGTYSFTVVAKDNEDLETTSSNLVVTIRPQVPDSIEFSALDSDGNPVNIAADVYEGPVDYLDFQFLGESSGDVVNGSEHNDFINLLDGDDAANGGAGQDIIDGGKGSNFLTGGAGGDTFYIDGRGGQVTWSTITDFSSEDNVNIWGYEEGVSQLLVVRNDSGAEGYKGLTYHYDLDNNGVIETSITFTGLTSDVDINVSSLTVTNPEQTLTLPYLLFELPEQTFTRSKRASDEALNEEADAQSNTTEAILNSASIAPDTEAVHCANELNQCAIPEGKAAVVWFGTEGGQYKRIVTSGTVSCTSNTFGGDPNIGQTEGCYYILVD